jgi:O-antigen ligase
MRATLALRLQPEDLPGARPARPIGATARIPSRYVEYAYYLVTIYSFVSAYLGIEVPLVAASGLIALTAVCVLQIRPRLSVVYAPIAWLLAAALSFIFVQVVIHGISPADPSIRTFVLWICSALIMQALCLRSGFVARCTICMMAIGLIALPHLAFEGDLERAKAGVELGGNLRNANGLGGWFGFCLISFAMLGLDARRMTHRVGYWSAAAASLLIAGLSVSRGAVLASGIAIVIGFRSVFKRGAVALAVLIVVGGVISQTRLFDEIMSRYEERGMEDTGRLVLWPHVVDRIWGSSLVGVGIDDISTYVPERGDSVTTPHNSYLYFALSSGFVPCIFWMLFWLRAGRKSFRSAGQQLLNRSYQAPFFIYVFINTMLGDITTDPWFLLGSAVAAGAGIAHRSARQPLHRVVAVRAARQSPVRHRAASIRQHRS